MTVEAERDDDDKEGGRNPRPKKAENSPTKRLGERTTTTIVPLKGLEESSPAPGARGRGRGRKSEMGSSPVKRGGLTVVKKRSRRKTFGDDTDGDVSIGATPPKRGRGRPRKSMPVVDDGEVMAEGTAVVADDEAPKTAATMLGKKVRGRRKAMSPVMIAVDETLDEDVHQWEGQPRVDDAPLALGESHLNKASSSSPQKVASRAGLISASTLETLQTSGSPNASSKQDVESADNEMWRSMITNHDEQSVNYRADASDRTNSADREVTGDPTNDHREYDSILESEGFSLVSLESIASARQNLGSPAAQQPPHQSESGIDVIKDMNLRSPNLADGVPTAKSSSVAESVSQRKAVSAPQRIDLGSKASMSSKSGSRGKESTADLQNMSSLQSSENGTEDGLSSTHKKVGLEPDSSKISELPSSPPVHLFPADQASQHQTPSLAFSSPSLPPPIQQGNPRSLHSSGKPKRDTPRLARVVRAGIALQGVLDTNLRSPSLRSPFSKLAKEGSSNNAVEKSPKERLDDLFEGFGAGTRRELRAGLRLGEELARRQKLIAQAQQLDGPCENGRSEDDVFADVSNSGYPKLPTPEDKEEYALALPASEQTFEYPSLQQGQLLSPERSERDEDEMSWKADTPVKVHGSGSPGSLADQDVFNESVASTPRRREAQWQRERKAISRQIEMANDSQVIVICDDDSDAEHGLGNLQDDDTGPLEADIWQVEAQSADHTPASPSPNDARFQEEVVKPRRSKIPSPWRRESQIMYSDESTEDQSGLFWQPDHRAKQMAREREERKKRKESHLDVSAMLGLKDNTIEETRAIDTHSSNTEVKEPLWKEAEMIINEEQMMEVDSIVEESYSSDEEQQTNKASDTICDDDALSEDGESANEVANGNLKTLEDRVSKAPVRDASAHTAQPTSTSWIGRLASIASLLWESNPTEEWTRDHYEMLDALYQQSKTSPTAFPYRSKWGIRPLLGMTIASTKYSMVITKDQLGIVDAFRDQLKEQSLKRGGDGKVPWDEEYVAKRLFSLIVGEDMRRKKSASGDDME